MKNSRLLFVVLVLIAAGNILFAARQAVASITAHGGDVSIVSGTVSAGPPVGVNDNDNFINSTPPSPALAGWAHKVCCTTQGCAKCNALETCGIDVSISTTVKGSNGTKAGPEYSSVECETNCVLFIVLAVDAELGYGAPATDADAHIEAGCICCGFWADNEINDPSADPKDIDLDVN